MASLALLCLACRAAGSTDASEARRLSKEDHRTFRGTYTKTLQPSGLGEIAAREAVGLSVAADDDEADDEEEDTCLLWSPTGSGACLQWASEQDAYTGRSRRFEKVQMEGTRDPRRGGSGTTR